MSKEQPKTKIRFLEATHVAELTTYSIQSILRLAASGQFPAPIKIGHRRRVWLESEVHQWMREKIQSGRR